MSGQEHNADKAWPFRPDHEQFGALRPPALRPATVSSRGRHRGGAVTGACEQIAAIWDQPHRGAATVAAVRAELGATIRRLRDDELPAVISWAHDQLRQGRYQFWIVFSLSYIERDARDLACGDCASEVHGSAGDRWRYRVIHTSTCPWWRLYQAGQVRGRVPCGAVVTHRGPYKRRPGGLT